MKYSGRTERAYVTSVDVQRPRQDAESLMLVRNHKPLVTREPASWRWLDEQYLHADEATAVEEVYIGDEIQDDTTEDEA